MHILQINDLYKSYVTQNKIPIPVLRGINLTVDSGDMTAVMGASGCGKTTLIHMIAGIDRADSGSVWIEDTNILELSKSEMAVFRRNHIGLIFQDFNLLESLNVKDNILLPLILDHIPEENCADSLEHIIRILSIQNITDNYITDISGGERQRTAIARALIRKPGIVLADEPTGSLDAKSTKDVMEYLTELNEKLQMTLLMVTHDVYAASCCRNVVMLKDGTVAAILEKGRQRREEFLEQIYEFLKQNRW
ncbi:MAG: ABC transporter ATP-binding protein [Lachnospiraceae bacterium]|nr:ABC transporter ATP-binding protein [Lachnospiraceae bacterium]